MEDIKAACSSIQMSLLHHFLPAPRVCVIDFMLPNHQSPRVSRVGQWAMAKQLMTLCKLLEKYYEIKQGTIFCVYRIVLSLVDSKFADRKNEIIKMLTVNN